MASSTFSLGHNPNASGEERKQYIEDLSVAKHHPDPRVRAAAQARLDAHGKGPNINDLSPSERTEFERRVREDNQRRGPQVATPTLGIAGEMNLTIDQLRLLAQKAGHDLVPMGDRPSGGAWVAKFESEIAQLKTAVEKKQQQCDTLHLRAVTAEQIAADAVRELRDLKGGEK
jgi:hypothetical protein